MSGVELFPLVLVAALVFTVPGALLGWVSGLRLPWAAAGSVPVSFGVFGLGAWVLGQLDDTVAEVTGALEGFDALRAELARQEIAGFFAAALAPAGDPSGGPAGHRSMAER